MKRVIPKIIIGTVRGPGNMNAVERKESVTPIMRMVNPVSKLIFNLNLIAPKLYLNKGSKSRKK